MYASLIVLLATVACAPRQVEANPQGRAIASDEARLLVMRARGAFWYAENQLVMPRAAAVNGTVVAKLGPGDCVEVAVPPGPVSITRPNGGSGVFLDAQPGREYGVFGKNAFGFFAPQVNYRVDEDVYERGCRRATHAMVGVN
jgi:hypothetical protein